MLFVEMIKYGKQRGWGLERKTVHPVKKKPKPTDPTMWCLYLDADGSNPELVILTGAEAETEFFEMSRTSDIKAIVGGDNVEYMLPRVEGPEPESDTQEKKRKQLGKERRYGRFPRSDARVQATHDAYKDMAEKYPNSLAPALVRFYEETQEQIDLTALPKMPAWKDLVRVVVDGQPLEDHPDTASYFLDRISGDFLSDRPPAHCSLCGEVRPLIRKNKNPIPPRMNNQGSQQPTSIFPLNNTTAGDIGDMAKTIPVCFECSSTLSATMLRLLNDPKHRLWNENENVTFWWTDQDAAVEDAEKKASMVMHSVLGRDRFISDSDNSEEGTFDLDKSMQVLEESEGKLSDITDRNRIISKTVRTAARFEARPIPDAEKITLNVGVVGFNSPSRLVVHSFRKMQLEDLVRHADEWAKGQEYVRTTEHILPISYMDKKTNKKKQQAPLTPEELAKSLHAKSSKRSDPKDKRPWAYDTKVLADCYFSGLPIPRRLVSMALHRESVEMENFSLYRHNVRMNLISLYLYRIKESHPMTDHTNPSVPFLCGQLLSLAGYAQYQALNNPPKTPYDRRMSRAFLRSPRTAFDVVQNQTNVYLGSIDKVGVRVNLSQQQSEILAIIAKNGGVPRRFTNEDKVDFHLGWGYQNAVRYKKVKTEEQADGKQNSTTVGSTAD